MIDALEVDDLLDTVVSQCSAQFSENSTRTLLELLEFKLD
jgi:hypothetical protein